MYKVEQIIINRKNEKISTPTQLFEGFCDIRTHPKAVNVKIYRDDGSLVSNDMLHNNRWVPA